MPPILSHFPEPNGKCDQQQLPKLTRQGTALWRDQILEADSKPEGSARNFKGLKWEAQSREPQEYSGNIMGIYSPGSLCSYYSIIVFLLYS